MADPTPLSPATQAVLDAAAKAMECPDGFLPYELELMAAALRAAADQLAQTPIVIGEPLRGNIAKDAGVIHVADLRAIVTELENQ